ncbi:MAG: CPBP family intramembrane metalloprotease [Myxococcales bacterium]|nr:CPBP family intramembrane metalloprotease [Myxococcales bacterium]
MTSTAEREATPRSAVREAFVTYAVATALASGLFWAGQVVPFIGNNLHGFIAVLFLYAPTVAARVTQVPFDYAQEGALTFERWRPQLGALAFALLFTWPPFVGGFFWLYGNACQPEVPAWAAWWWQTFAPICPRWLGSLSPPWRLPPDFALLALTQVLVVALPEELFFRGYLWSRLSSRWPGTRRLLGAPLGFAWLVTSLLFALGHVAVDLDPGRMAVIFPALVFGWMRARSGSIVPGVVFHASCNLLSDVLYETYFR